MTKTTGLGDRFLVGGYDISGDTQAVDNVHGGPAPLDFTDITRFAHVRLGGLRDGGMQFTTFFNPTTGNEHTALSGLPRTDTIMTYLRGAAVGNPGACLNAKQVNYDPTRGADGSLTLKTEGQGSSYGLEWGLALTAGVRTDTAATNGTSIDTTASLNFGAQAYLQASAFTGTDVTAVIQDSADNATWANVAGLSFAQITGSVPQTQRISVVNTATVRRYLRVITTTTGGFTSFSFAVVVMKNPVAGVVF